MRLEKQGIGIGKKAGVLFSCAIARRAGLRAEAVITGARKGSISLVRKSRDDAVFLSIRHDE